MLQSSRPLCRQALARHKYGWSDVRDTAFSSCSPTHIARCRPCPSANLNRGPNTSLSARTGYLTISQRLCIHSSRRLRREQETPTTTSPLSAATATETHAQDVPPPPPSLSTGQQQQQQQQRRQRRRGRGPFYIAMLFLAGILAGTATSSGIAPPALPATDSDAGRKLQAEIQARGAALPLVKQLEADPAWTSWDAYAGISTSASSANPRGASAAQSRITSGPMSGISGLAFQRIFHNGGTGEVVSVVYFGPALAGWPGVVHGGALATVLDESLGRCAILKFPSRTGVTANLELQYRAPTMIGTFYVLRAQPVVSEDDDVVGRDGVRKGDRKLWVNGTLETVNGKPLVNAKALFVVPKAYRLRPLVEGF